MVGKAGESGKPTSPADAAHAGPRDFSAGDLLHCLDAETFFVEYQPKVALLSDSTAHFGVEALCRMHHPAHGAITPDIFIAAAERHGLIARLTEGVVRHSLTAWRKWSGAGLHIRLALNISPLLLNSDDWCRSFLLACSEFSMDPKWITLEITETAAGATSTRACDILCKLQKKGFSLSIDDFGTGFSSLATLYKLPISEMKIDKSFIFDFQQKAGARELVMAAIAMAKRLGIKVVAEGVEDEGMFRELRRIGCDEAQGYFVGKAMPANSVVPFFTTWRKETSGRLAGDPPKQTLPGIVVAQALLNELVGDLAAPTQPRPNSYAQFAVRSDLKARPREIVQKIPALMLAGKSLDALGHCHEVLREMKATAGGGQIAEKLEQVQSYLEHELLSSGELELRSSYETIRLLPRSSATIGQRSAAVHADIPINCHWFGAGGKNLRVFQDAGDFFLEDLGSKNGCLANGERLKVGDPIEIPYGRTIVEARVLSGVVAPLSILLHRKSSDPDAISIRLDCDKEILRANLSEREWFELKGQLGATWIMFSNRINIGKSSDCAIVVSDCALPLAGTISFDGGFWIEPATGSAFELEDIRLHQRSPLVADSRLCLAKSLIEVKRVC